MVPNSGSRRPFLPPGLTDAGLANLIGAALQRELGGSRRATKTVMLWTGVSDHTARSWINGRASPSSLHLLELAAHCGLVLSAMLDVTGHAELMIGLKLEAIEQRLEEALDEVRRLRT